MIRHLSRISGDRVGDLARAAGFEISGVAPAGSVADFDRYIDWADAGNAGAMGYLTDGRAELRSDVRRLLPEARSVICVGKLYNGPEAYSIDLTDTERGWISRYAWGDDYHGVLTNGLNALVKLLQLEAGPFTYKVCVDTAPLLERSLARQAGLGWIGKNTCLINQWQGSWFFLGELITSLDIELNEHEAASRCGTCSRCIDACPTAAIVPTGANGYQVDARLCISYLTIELKSSMEEGLRSALGNHVFGCDICQDVCPWNGRAAQTEEIGFAPRDMAPPLEKLARLTETEFRAMYRGTPIERAKYRGFLRNVAVAMGNSGAERFREPLRGLALSRDDIVAEHARWALGRLDLGK